ncbi:MAG: type 1 glutamine amidotransferase domain-containing protein [bacterium]
MSPAIFVVTEQGYWGEECITPLKTMSEENIDITVTTPTGNKPSIDERSIDPDSVGEELAGEVEACHENDDRLNAPVALAEVEPSDYDVAVFPGGHGTVWDINQDKHARRILTHMVETGDKKALVVCHAVGILAFTRTSTGELLVAGRNVTGFPNEWEQDIVDQRDCMPDGRKLPYWVEDEVKAAGGLWDAELDKDESVTVDGDLVTARGPGSSEKGVNTFLKEMGVA